MVTQNVNHNFTLCSVFYCILNIVNNSKDVIQRMLTATAELWVFYAANKMHNWKMKQSILVKLLIYILEWHEEKGNAAFFL